MVMLTATMIAPDSTMMNIVGPRYASELSFDNPSLLSVPERARETSWRVYQSRKIMAPATQTFTTTSKSQLRKPRIDWIGE